MIYPVVSECEKFGHFQSNITGAFRLRSGKRQKCHPLLLLYDYLFVTVITFAWLTAQQTQSDREWLQR